MSSWAFMMSLRYCGCTDCYGRFLFRERSWYLMIQPSPCPRFYFEESRAEWRVGFGWFRLCVAHPGWKGYGRIRAS